MGFIVPTPGYSDERIYIFAAGGMSAMRAALEDDEIIEPFELPLDEALERIATGEIIDAKTIAGLLRLRQEVDAGRMKP